MEIEAIIRRGDELLVETLLVCARFVSRSQKNGLPVRIKGKGNTPDTFFFFLSQLFHVSVSGILERIDIRTPQNGALAFKNKRMRKDCILRGLRKFIEFGLERSDKLNFPNHAGK